MPLGSCIKVVLLYARTGIEKATLHSVPGSTWQPHPPSHAVLPPMSIDQPAFALKVAGFLRVSC